MRRVVLTALGVVACAGALSAQTVVREIDLSIFRWGVAEARPVEVDGQPRTVEWLIRVTRFDSANVCASCWSVPRGSASARGSRSTRRR